MNLDGFFNMDNKFFTFMGKVADFMLLNILWLLCSLPIVTLGASTTALYYVTLKIAEGEEPYIIKSFFHSFKSNLRQGIILGFLWLFILATLFFDFSLFLTGSLESSSSLSTLLFFALLVVSLIFAFLSCYLFALQARFENTINGTIKMAFILSIKHLPKSLCMALALSVPFVLFFVAPNYFIRSFVFWFLLGGSIIAFLHSIFLAKIFAPYMTTSDSTETL